MKKLLVTAFLGMAISAPRLAHAVQGVNDYNVFMMRDFTGAGCSDHFGEQWDNYYDFVGEMNHVASCYECGGDVDVLEWWLATYWIGSGHDADLIAVDTHGHDESSQWTHVGWINNRACQLFRANDMGPADWEYDNWIYLFNICDIYETDNIGMHYTFRNLHRTGAPISVGCWGLCYLAESAWSTTWNEVGDSIADNGESIWTAWKDGHTVMYDDDDIITMGAGTNGNGWCAWNSNSTTWANRTSHWGPSYEWNHDPVGGPDDVQFCGYYLTNW